MTEAMPFLQNYDITFLRPPPIPGGLFVLCGFMRLSDSGGQNHRPQARKPRQATTPVNSRTMTR